MRTTTPITSRKSSVQKPGFPDGFLGACTELNPVYRRLIKMALEELQFLEHQMGQLEQEIANLLRPHVSADLKRSHSRRYGMSHVAAEVASGHTSTRAANRHV